VKLLLLLFNVFVLLLPGLPCTDRGNCNDTAASSITARDHANDHETEDEDCNPFCACACCGHIASVNCLPASTNSDQTIEKKTTISYPGVVSPTNGFDGNIFQPPKL
jgi:hypothetical protein